MSIEDIKSHKYRAVFEVALQQQETAIYSDGHVNIRLGFQSAVINTAHVMAIISDFKRELGLDASLRKVTFHGAAGHPDSCQIHLATNPGAGASLIDSGDEQQKQRFADNWGLVKIEGDDANQFFSPSNLSQINVALS